MKVETNIIASFTASLVGRTRILVIIYFETFKTNVFIWVTLTIIFSSMVIPLILKISLGEIKGKMDELLINLIIKTKFYLGRGGIIKCTFKKVTLKNN